MIFLLLAILYSPPVYGVDIQTLSYADVVEAHSLPDPVLTPGSTREVDVHTLCTTSTKLVRNVPESVKKQVYIEYGLPGGNHTGYCDPDGCEDDHLISLELGGSNDIKNQWIQPYGGVVWNAHVKDRYENFLHSRICTGKMTIKEAQDEIRINWIEGYKKHPELPLPTGEK